MSNEVTVVATRWTKGWELGLPGAADPITQVATLDKAPQQVIDYLDTVEPDVDHGDWIVTVLPSDEEISTEIRTARDATRAAARAQEDAARSVRVLVARLDAAGYRAADIAGVLGITRARVSQLQREIKVAS